MNRHIHKTDWNGLLTLMLLPVVAFGLIYVSMHSNYDPMKAPPRAIRRELPAPSMLLDRSGPVSHDLGKGGITDQQIASLVTKMESLTDTQPELELAQDDDTPTRPAQAAPPPVTPKAAEMLPSPDLRVAVLAEDLVAPDGLAIDPRTSNLYVSEEEANRIVVITPKGRKRVVLKGDELLPDDSGPRRVRQPPLQSPEGLAMDSEGWLYVVEDRPGGRLLRVLCSEDGKARKVEMIPLPGHWEPFAWEAVAVSPRGEILLGGSSAEGKMKEGATLFQGALLYRDAEKTWWVLSLRPASGVSAVAFSPDGEFAIYTDEINGAVSWIDLTTREVREGASYYSARSPEGLAVMPDGRLVVAEERGRLVLLDPRRDANRTIMDDLGQIESVIWDGANNQLLVSSDSKGQILALPVEAPWPVGQNAMAAAPVDVEGAVHHVPEYVPEFLTPLIDLGLTTTNDRSPREILNDLTRKVPIMAADSRTTLLYSTETGGDPIVQLVFVAVAPNGIMTDDIDQEFSVSAVILRTRSGQVYRSKLTRMSVLAGNMVSGKFDNLGTFDLPIPFAYQAKVSSRGHAVIHFAGLGQSPDVSIAINPEKPTESFMVVSYITGVIEQYRLERAPDGSLNNWLVSLPPRRPDTWTSLKNTVQ
jgi:sugar lactone lactonase YvrE